MKVLLLLCILVTTGYSNLLKPYNDGDRFFFMADNSGKLHLIDAQDKPEPIRAGRSVDSYLLYTSNNMNTPQTVNDANIGVSNFDADLQTFFIVHGWTGSGTAESNILIKDAILENGSFNVISVDWSTLASGSYATAVEGTLSVGEELGRFVAVVNGLGVDYSDMQLIGFSLGAHIVGIAGRAVGGQVQRVTGLDPAGPLWSADGDRIRDTDGLYVEIVHTNAGVLGYRDAIGHTDFYPNGGSIQPGCSVIAIDCSHGRSYQYFAESVNSDSFVGNSCGTVNQALLGLCSGDETLTLGSISFSKTGSGIFHLSTNSESPFAQG